VPHAATGLLGKKLTDTPSGRPDSKKYYGEQGEIDMAELRKRMAAAAQRGEKYTGPMPMKEGS
jgi:hypothetical protein